MLRSFCPVLLLCGPRQGSAPLWALALPSASPELVCVGSEGRLVLFAGFRKSLGPQQQRCPTPTLPSIGRRGVGVEGETPYSAPQASPQLHGGPPPFSSVHCSIRNAPPSEQPDGEMTAFPGEHSGDQNRPQPSFLPAVLIQVQGQASGRGLARAGPSQGLPSGPSARSPHYRHEPE